MNNTLKKQYTLKKKVNNTYNKVRDDYDISSINFSNDTELIQQGGKNRVKKFFKRLFKTKKAKINSDKPIEVSDTGFTFKNRSSDSSYNNRILTTYNTLNDRLSEKQSDKLTKLIEGLINAIFNYNIESITIPNIDINIIFNDKISNRAKEVYYKLLNSNQYDRKYRLLPSFGYMRKIYKTDNSVSVFLRSIYDYICINSIFENIIFNAINSYISNTFNVNNSNYVKRGLSIFTKENVEQYVSEHNPIFEKIYKCKIDLSKIGYTNIKPITKSPQIQPIVSSNLNQPNIPSNNEYLNLLISIPGRQDNSSLNRILGIKMDDSKKEEKLELEQQTEKSNTTIMDANEKYLKIINSNNLIKSAPSLKDKIDSFNKINYKTIVW